MQFMFTDIAETITWSVIDFWRIPKKAYYTLKESFSPVYIFMDWPKVKYRMGRRYMLNVYIVNDLHTEFRGIARLYIDDIEVWAKDVTISPDSLHRFRVPVVFRDRGERSVKLSLNIGQREITNEYRVLVV